MRSKKYKALNCYKKRSKNTVMSFFSRIFKSRGKSSSRQGLYINIKSKKRGYRGRIYNQAFNSHAGTGFLYPLAILRARAMFPLLIILLLLQFFLIFFSGYFSVSKVFVYGAKQINQEEYLNLIENNLRDKRFFFLPLNNIFIINQDIISAQLKQKYPIDNVKLEKLMFDRYIKVEIEEKEPVVIASIEDQYYFMDYQGDIIGLVENDDELVGFPIIYDSFTEVQPDLQNLKKYPYNETLVSSILLARDFFAGQNFVNLASFKLTVSPQVKIEEVKEEVKEEVNDEEKNDKKGSLKTEDIRTDFDPEYEISYLDDSEFTFFELSAVMSDGLEIYLGHDVFFPEQNNLKIKLDSLNIILPEIAGQISGLSYIDARIDNQIFYK